MQFGHWNISSLVCSVENQGLLVSHISYTDMYSYIMEASTETVLQCGQITMYCGGMW